MSNWISLKVLRGAAEWVQDILAELTAKAHKANHSVFYPTHVAMKDNKVVGYFSIAPGGIVPVFAWFGEEMQPRESFHTINTIENLVSGGGGQAICWPVPKDSPFHDLMPSMGYKNVGEYSFWIKEL